MNVLMVDDHVMFLQGMKNLLSVLVPELRVETTGEMAHAVQLAELADFDLVLLDWHLAECDGEESIRRLRDVGLHGAHRGALRRDQRDADPQFGRPRRGRLHPQEVQLRDDGGGARARAGRAHLPAAGNAQRRAAGHRRPRRAAAPIRGSRT